MRLGSRINNIIHGLRTKLILERFVSKGTALVAKGAAGSAGPGEDGGRAAPSRDSLERHPQLHGLLRV